MTSKPLSIITLNNPLLEVNPSACLFVLGPAATGSKTCKELLESATAFLQAQKKLSFIEKRKLIAEIKRAEKKDSVGAALQAALDALVEMNSFSEWLQSVFQDTSPSPPSPCRTLEQLLELQKQGALLACTQLDALPGTRQATLHNDESFKCWLSSEVAENEIDVESDNFVAVLHLCGLYSHPKTIWMKKNFDTQFPPFSKLKKILQERVVIFLGFSTETQNPFVGNFLNHYYSRPTEGILKYPPIMLTSELQKGSNKNEDIFSPFLTLQVQEKNEELLGNLIAHRSKKNFSVARGLTDKQTEGTKYQAFLLFNEKQSFRKLGEIIYRQSRSGEIYVRRDALSVIFSSGRILYSNIITYGGNGLRQLWELVFADRSSLLGKGLIGFGLQNSAIVWIRGRPEGLGDVTNVNTTYAGKSSMIQVTMKNKDCHHVSTHSPAQASPWSSATSSQPQTNTTISSPILTSAYNVIGDSSFDTINIPPPPKLIKIADEKHTTTTTHSWPPPSSSPPSIISPLSVEESLKTGEAKCSMQAILDLQKRISQQLESSTDRFSLAMVKVSDSVNTATPFRPPCYCVAGAPELLLNVIGQTAHVRMHEHAIELIEQPEATRNVSLSTTRSPDSTPQPSHMTLAPDRKRKRLPSSAENNFPSSSRFTLTSPPASTPTPTPTTRHHTNASNVLMAASPNYCLALNTFPVMLVNSTMSLVQPVPALPLATGLPPNQVLCYMPPNKIVKPLTPSTSEQAHFKSEQQTRATPSSLLYTPLSLSPPSCADSAVDSSPHKIERVYNEAIGHILSSRKCSASEATTTTESDCSDESEGASLTSQAILSSDGNVQLWVFLLELLLSPDHKSVIHWTGQGYEFCIAQPAALARLWGHHRNKPQMTYEKMSRALRYYYSRGTIESVRGRKQTFRFSIDLLNYVATNKDQRSVDYLKTCCQL